MPLRRIHIRLIVGLLALALPAAALAAIALGLVLFHFNVLGLKGGQIWVLASAGVGVVALAVLGIGRAAGWIAWRWTLLLALPALAPIAAGGLAMWYLDRHPSTAEISTDLIDPPAFLGPAARPFPQALIELGHARHGAVRSLTVRPPPDQAYAQVMALAEVQPGWRVTASMPPETFQGTAVFGRFGYSRDWVIRLRPELSGGTLVDMRIRSRPGEPDLGDNADMVLGFLAKVRAAAAPPAS